MGKQFELSPAQLRAIKEVQPAGAFLIGYITALLWTEEEQLQVPEPGLAEELRISPQLVKDARSDCADFMRDASAILNSILLMDGTYTLEQAGIDLWLSRNGHGAGYFDRGSAWEWSWLQERARQLGSKDAYLGDDGYVHMS